MLFSINKILVCIDLREDSQDFLKNVEKLRAKAGAAVDIIYVNDVRPNIEWVSPVFKEDSYYSSFMGEMKRLLQSRLQNEIDEAGLRAKGMVLEGRPVDKILEICENYDLMIIGHKPQRHFPHFLGGIARKLITTVDMPVLVLTKDIHFERIGCLVEPATKHEWLITSAFDFYRTMKFHDIEFISLWHDLPGPINRTEMAKELCEKLEEDIDYFKREGEGPTMRFEPTQDIQIANHAAHIIQEDQIDLAVMGRNRGNTMEKIFLGSETLRMLENRPTNLLVMPV